MSVRLSLVAALLLASSSSLAAAPVDKAGCADHPLFPTRMPSYLIEKCETKEFDLERFTTPKGKVLPIEGRVTRITYYVTDRKLEQSGVAVVRNYENALVKIGGKVANIQPERYVNGSVTVDGKEVWAEVNKGNGKIWLVVVEKKAMEQHVVADAASFANDLKASGHTAVYGIYFDSGKSELKPESTPALTEVAKLLAADPSLKLWVVGHTDWVGGAEGNMKLAQARADAVVKELATKHGIAAARLKGYGVGPLSPLATNDSEEGRAKNRRVDLVKQP